MRYAFILTILIFSFSFSSAQILPSQNSAFSEINAVFEPEYPNPGDLFTISLQSYSQNLQGMHIEWLLDGLSFREGVGITSITATAPKSDEFLTVTVKIEGAIIWEKVINSTTVDILWEANTYTPRGYLGRALPVDKATITAVAIPHGIKKDTKLIYNWYKNGTLLVKESGFDRNTIQITGPGLYSDYNLSVTISNINQETLGQNGVKIVAVKPEIVFYEKSALLGTLFHTSLTKESQLSESIERVLVAEPYYFSVINPLDLLYTWRISNTEYLEGEAPNVLIIKNFLEGASITTKARHSSALLQSSSTTYTPLNINSLVNQDGEGSYRSPFGEN
jgi:hypothetical protein